MVDLTKRSKVLFVLCDERFRYLHQKLEEELNLIDCFYAEISQKELFFWANLLSCALEMMYAAIKKGHFVKITKRMLYINSTRRPDFIREMSSRVQKRIDSIKVKPDLILQLSSMFAPYVQTPSIPFALIIDNYADRPNSPNQKNKLRGWSTLYDESYYRFQKQIYSNAFRIFTLSKWCKEGLSREYNIDPEKIRPIGWGPGVEIDLAASTPKKDQKTILCVGSDYIAKGFDVMVKSAKYLQDFLITIVGRDDRHVFKNIDIPRNVKILNYVSDEKLSSLYSKSELFFILSRFDPSPLALWEAQAHGCVVVGYDAYGISEAVINNTTGILLKTRDPLLVAEAIRKLYREEGKIKSMGEAAIENYKKNGTWKRVSKILARELQSGTFCG
jgi:glycosyltransferase involved in cell wall biosynthesis